MVQMKKGSGPVQGTKFWNRLCKVQGAGTR
jgi:hypothetical protein